MSTIDQAFIRAYQERLAKGTVMPVAEAAAPHSEREELSKEKVATAQSQPTARIDAAADAAIPAPHADFAKAQEVTSGATPELPKPAFGQSSKAALSSFAETSSGSGSPAAFFKPALEVDAVCWPAICGRLVAQFPDRFDSLADEIRRAAESHCKVVAVSGLGRSEGRTTLVLCLARCLAARTKLAIIDGDFANPCLAHQLGIGPEAGWETVLKGTQQLSEVTIQSAADRLDLVPLAAAIETAEPAQLSYRVAVSLAELADHYDLVLIDAGPMSGEPAVANRFMQPSSGVQGIILTHDVRRGEASRLAAACLEIAASHQNLLGIAETFTS
jgi:Mrp family chromosome partitioning ATPase